MDSPKAPLVLLTLFIFLAGVAAAGEISPGLQKLMAETESQKPLKAMIFLREQVDIESLNRQLRQAKATRADRHRQVITGLQDQARATQGDLLAALAAGRRDGRVLGFTPHWLVNGIVVVATADALWELAAHPDVAVIEPDLEVALIEPVAQEMVPAAKAGRGIGITPGVVNIGARRVWDELQIRGEGALIGTLDTGVDGTHEALAGRWRGLSVPWPQAWRDALGTGTEFPVDLYGHGTHVTGTIAGLAPDDTIGVAPAAEWIACNAIDQISRPGFDNDIIAALEWFADPDGDPETVADVPDVVQNSWGVNQSYGGYIQCDSRWWAMIDACEAAGVVLTWSAGNDGPSAMTMVSPADRATTIYNCFSVGATIAVPPFTIAAGSSRGPAGADCGPAENLIKPEIVAPGSDIYSAVPGGYGYKSGTSMAGPHVAGVVALMRSAKPDLDVDTIKQVLMDTALDLGPEGEDNTYGHGLVDAYLAVATVLGGIGHVEGTVVAGDTGKPVAGAIVVVAEPSRAVKTDPAGKFRLILKPGVYELEMSAFGFFDGSAAVTVAGEETQVVTFTLDRLPSATISGTVFDPAGQPAAGAAVSALETPLLPELTDGSGFYSLILPLGAAYTLRAAIVGVGIATAEVVLSGDMTLDLHMDALRQDSFETGDLTAFPWTIGGHVPWRLDSSQTHHGLFSVRSGQISHNEHSVLRITVDVLVASDLSFFYKISSEANHDFLEFWVDGARVARWAGEVPWSEHVQPVSPGSHTFEWVYRKDGSVSQGADTAWLDLVSFPQMTEPPRIALDLPGLATKLRPGGTGSQILNLANLGEQPLVYWLTARPSAGKTAPPHSPAAEPPRREEDPGTGGVAPTGQGGPDAFGYRWLDSNAPGGPVYAWVDISGQGIALPDQDDATLGPFPLGFAFDYYGVDYTEVRICTNGFLTFANTTLAPDFPLRFPNATAPNAVVAPFWTDLNPVTAGTIYYRVDGANQRFIVQFQAVAQYWQVSVRETFQAILTPDGEIRFQYHTVTDGSECSVGIENESGTIGLSVVYNTGGYLQNNKAIAFRRAPLVPWLRCDPARGTVAGGGVAAVAVDFDAAGLDEGVYRCDLIVGSNGAPLGEVVVPVTLVVRIPTAVEPAPPAFALYDAVPNPFNPFTTLRFSLPAAGRAELKLYDVQGRLVRTLIDGQREAGTQDVRWDGRDRGGRRVAAGTYYARLRAAGQTSVKAVMLVK